jgi:hypothetical protein
VKSIFLSRVRLRLRVAAGTLLNLLGFPGFVRECKYRGTQTEAEITVQQGALFTIISVNGLDIYFHRLTGTIDGVGSTNCKQVSVRELAPVRELHGQIQNTARRHNA